MEIKITNTSELTSVPTKVLRKCDAYMGGLAILQINQTFAGLLQCLHKENIYYI